MSEIKKSANELTDETTAKELSCYNKATEELKNELSSSVDIEKYLLVNEGERRDQTLSEYLEELLTVKRLSKAEVINNSLLEKTYAYRIFAGKKKHPSRKKTLALALAMKLSQKETQRLLYCAGCQELYVRNPWDSVIFYGLEHGYSVMDTELLLEKVGEKSLFDNESE